MYQEIYLSKCPSTPENDFLLDDQNMQPWTICWETYINICLFQLHSCNPAACYCQSAKAPLNPQFARYSSGCINNVLRINRGVWALGFFDTTAANLKRLPIDLEIDDEAPH